MPDDPKHPHDGNDEARLAQIRADRAYYAKAVQAGGQPPTVYATKYVEDIDFLLRRWSEPRAEEPLVGVRSTATETPLEEALRHDAAGRSERR